MEQNEMLDFIKAKSDADSLRIIGMLTQRSASVKEVCPELGIPFKDAHASHGGIPPPPKPALGCSKMVTPQRAYALH